MQFLSENEKKLILDYAENDGEVTLTLDEIKKLFVEIESLNNQLKFQKEYYSVFTEESGQ